MEKEKYVKPTCRAILLTHRMQLLEGSGSDKDRERTPPEEIEDYDDWLE